MNDEWMNLKRNFGINELSDGELMSEYERVLIG